MIIDLVSFDLFNFSFITAHKRSLGQGNVFTGVCLFTRGVYACGEVLTTWGVCLRGVCIQRFGRRLQFASWGKGWSNPSPPPNQKSRRYASYWNTVLSVTQFVEQFLNFVAKLRKNISFFFIQHSNFVILPGAAKSVIC